MKILVIEARGLPAGFLGCYGNEWVGTPCMDRLASEGITFDNHIAARPDVRATTPTYGNAKPSNLSCAGIDSVIGFGPAALAAWRQAPAGGILWIDGPNLALPWSLPGDLLDSYCDADAGEEPWPDPPRGVWPKIEIDDLLRLHNTFAAVVTYFDAQLDVLLQDMGTDALVCITARGGLPLGEHGLVGAERAWLHQELVHVPLVMRLPGNSDPGRRIAALTQPEDLLPALASLLAEDAAHGHGLLPLLSDETEIIRPYACSALAVGESAELALRTPDWALLVPTSVPPDDPPRGPQLYVKPGDRWEVNDVRHHHLEFAEALEATLDAFQSANADGRRPLVYPPLPAFGNHA